MRDNAVQQAPIWAERFWSKVLKVEGECWEWQAGKYPTGYGRFYAEGHYRGTHRISYELTKGPIPIGMFICHTCDNHGCVNPMHLFAGAPKDNTQDMIRKGRSGLTQHKGRRVRTHCNKGHEWSGYNLQVNKSEGYIKHMCRACRLERDRINAAKAKAKKSQQ